MLISHQPNQSERCLCIDKDKVYYYRDLKEFMKFIKVLIEPRSLIILVTDNDQESLFMLLACIEMRIVPIILNRQISEESLYTYILNFNPDYIYLPTNIILHGDSTEIIFATNDYSIIKFNVKNPKKIYKNLALLLPTSGSTGGQKVVRISYENIFSNASSIREYLCINQEDRAITTLPPSYSYGLSVIFSHVLSGASIYLNKFSVLEKQFWINFENNQITNFAGVPYTYEMLTKINFKSGNYQYLRFFTQAGGKLPEHLALRFATDAYQSEKEFYIMYGQTEATARMTYITTKDILRKPTSIGKAIPGGQITLDSNFNDGSLEKSNKHVVGELVYSGKNVSLGYAASYKDLQKSDANLGILKTGDLARQDDDGYFYIVGRLSRFIKIFGVRVSLDDIENRLLNYGHNVACTVKNEKVLLHYTDEQVLDEIRADLNKIHRSLDKFIVFHKVNKIPRTPSSKIDYRKLLE